MKIPMVTAAPHPRIEPFVTSVVLQRHQDHRGLAVKICCAEMVALASRRFLLAWIAIPAVLLLSACDSPQSALDPSGPAASEIAVLWWFMFWSAVIIFALVLSLLLYAALRSSDKRGRMAPRHLVVIGGIVFPVTVLSILLPFGINVGSRMDALTGPETLTIRVNAHQWWWEIEYQPRQSQSTFITANELYIPVGQPVELLLNSADVIHSFWIPRLAGKRDLIPGRTNRLVIEADEPGIFRGQCAEFCGKAHAMMAFHAVALPPAAFGEWAERQQRPQPTDPVHPGAALFNQNGCGFCHSIRGHQARGREAPDLTHIGSRKTIGAGLLANTPQNIALWLAHNDELKPGNRMPEYRHLNLGDRMAIAAYLEGLE